MKNLNIGVWIDSDKAFIVKLTNSLESHEYVESNIDHSNYKTGRGSSSPAVFQAVKSEKHLLEKKKHEQNKYFESIFNIVSNADSILIWGPAELKVLFSKFLLEKKFNPDNTTVQTGDSMSENQMIAHVKNFFSS